MRKAFTLIELLVVVLIIGILAAIALPQYQKAVFKSRLSTVWINIKTIKDCFDIYKLTNGLPASGQVKLTDMGCPAELSGGEWQKIGDVTTGNYVVGQFLFQDMYCNSSKCQFEIQSLHLPLNSRFSIHDEGETNKKCFTFESPLGRSACQAARELGYEYIDEWD